MNARLTMVTDALHVSPLNTANNDVERAAPTIPRAPSGLAGDLIRFRMWDDLVLGGTREADDRRSCAAADAIMEIQTRNEMTAKKEDRIHKKRQRCLTVNSRIKITVLVYANRKSTEFYLSSTVYDFFC